jgi:hypothetical protein
MSGGIVTGGPAFPCWSAKENQGMSLRDYLAAHAPAEPASWFTPVGPPRPDPEWPEGFGPPDGPPLNQPELDAWDEVHARDFTAQWPWAWADAVLATRG